MASEKFWVRINLETIKSWSRKKANVSEHDEKVRAIRNEIREERARTQYIF